MKERKNEQPSEIDSFIDNLDLGEEDIEEEDELAEDEELEKPKVKVEKEEVIDSKNLEENIDPSHTFNINTDESKFNIKFDKLFNQEKLQVYNSFDLTAKRNFKMMLNEICETYKTIFINEDGNVKPELMITLLQILNVQSKIMKEKSISLDDFLSLIDKVVSAGENALYNAIDKLITTKYALTLDEDTKKMKEKKKNVNDQLIISDEYGKVLIKIAYLDRLMIPLISQFFIYNKEYFPTKISVVDDPDSEETEDLVFNEINQKIFEHIFSIIAKDKTENIETKLYKIVWARVVARSASDSGFWMAASKNGISKESSSLDIYTKLISNSIPKLILSKELNLVNFFSVIINNQILFLFSNKFKTHYHTINPSSVGGSMFETNDDDNLTELEKMEIRLGRKNEGSLIIKNVIAKDVIKKIDTLLDVSVSKEEIANILAFIHINPIQEKIVALLTFKYFKSTDAIKRLTVFEYAKVLLCVVKYLERQKFILLPKVLLSNCIKQRDRTAITGTKIKTQIEQSKRYNELMENKYKDFKSEISRNIQSTISTIYNSSFIDVRGNDVFESTAKIGNIAEEIVDLCFLI